MLIVVSLSLPLRTISVFASEIEVASQSAEIVETGSASAVINIENILNTSVIDTAVASSSADIDPKEIEVLPPGDDFQLNAVCNQLNQLIDELDIVINNDTTVDQVFNLLVDSGNNSIETGQIRTGDTVGEVQLVQQINTTLIGSCWSYLDKTIFEETSEDVILPYEAEIIETAKSATSEANPTDTQINIENSLVNTEEINQNTDTGTNTTGGGEIITGDSSVSTQVIDSVNKNIIADSWFYLEINNPWYWTGEVVGQDLDFIKTENSWYYWGWYGQPNNTSQSSESSKNNENISINNRAKINTEINTLVGSGNNQILNSGSIITGDATSAVKIRNNINTTIIGDNWYYASINLFAPFSGNLVFARADLIAEILSGTLFLKPGDILELPISYKNSGQTTAKNSILKVNIPSQLELYNSDPTIQVGQSVYYQLGDLSPGVSGVIKLKLLTDNIKEKTNSVITAELISNTLEADLGNNKSSVQLVFEPQQGIISIGENQQKTENYDQPSQETQAEVVKKFEINTYFELPPSWEPQSISDPLVLGLNTTANQEILFSAKDIACKMRAIAQSDKALDSYLIFGDLRTFIFVALEWLRKLVS